MTRRKFLALPLAAGLAVCLLRADEPPKPAEPGTLVVIDGNGKEQKLKTWKFVQGTRHLSWLAPDAPEKEPGDKEPAKAPPARAPKGGPKAPAKRPAVGPEALEFRDEHSTTFIKGVLTFIPLDRLRDIEYDKSKDSVTVRVAGGEKPEQDVTLTGSTKFQGINKLTIEAEVDKGTLGVAEVKFFGGTANGIRGIRFPAPKPVAGPAGKAARVTIQDKTKHTDDVTDVQVLYQLAGGKEVVSPLLFFKKTIKIDVGQLKKLTSTNPGALETVCEVDLKDGTSESLTVLTTPMLDGKEATLEGLLARVPAGYKLYPIHTIAEVEFNAPKEAPKPEK